jgi:histidine ammonia-lyase/tyrosine ammonia-lyase
MACDFLNIAIAEIGVLAERQLNRLVDPHINGTLPAFLASGESGLYCGYEGAQYLATSIAAENLDLAAPSSIKSIPSNGSNQDVVSMGLTSARKSVQLCANVETILGVLTAACYQASCFIGPEKFSPPVRELMRQLSEILPVYKDDSIMADYLERVREFLRNSAACKLLDLQIDLLTESSGASVRQN